MEYTRLDFKNDVTFLASLISDYEAKQGKFFHFIAGIPQGGIPLAMALAQELGKEYTDAITSDPGLNNKFDTLIVDDLIDSGETIRPFMAAGFSCAVIGIKPDAHKLINSLSFDIGDTPGGELFYSKDFPQNWIHFWWEPSDTTQDPKKYITRILEYIGEKPKRDGLIETPDRVVRSWDTIYGGYAIDPKSVFKKFDEPVQDDLVIMRNIQFASTCEHHMLPFIGKAHIAYIPKGNKVIGASKMVRLLNIFARRLQIQERIAQQVCDAMEKYLECYGCACIIEAVHSCILCRGVENATAELVTPVLRGAFRKKEKSALRAELYANLSR